MSSELLKLFFRMPKLKKKSALLPQKYDWLKTGKERWCVKFNFSSHDEDFSSTCHRSQCVQTFSFLCDIYRHKTNQLASVHISVILFKWCYRLQLLQSFNIYLSHDDLSIAPLKIQAVRLTLNSPLQIQNTRQHLF